MLIIIKQISCLLYLEISLFAHPTTKYILLLILFNQYFYLMFKNVKFLLMKAIKYRIKLKIFKKIYKKVYWLINYQKINILFKLII